MKLLTKSLNGKLFLSLLLFNALLFISLARLLPLNYETNDDAAMCMIANGVYSGMPDAHLIFINYLYGWLLTLLYNTFSGVEWYTVSFCIIHIVSLTAVAFVILTNTRKSGCFKSIFLFFLYIIEARNIFLFQFTTTAAIGGFAGLLLLFGTKKIHKIYGSCLFLAATLVRFDAAMLVMLLMLPVFVYETFSDAKNKVRLPILVAVCICGAFLLRSIDRRIYYGDGVEWIEYLEYNAARGRINDNPNARNLTKLPSGISFNDYRLLLSFFPDVNIVNLPRIKELSDIVSKVALKEKLRNIYPSLMLYRIPLLLIAGMFVVSFFLSRRIKIKFLMLFYFAFYIGVLSYISMDGFLKQRVFVSALFPILFFLHTYNVADIQKIANAKTLIFIGLSVTFISLAAYFAYKTRNRKYNDCKFAAESRSLMNKIRNKDLSLIAFPTDIKLEKMTSPLDIKSFFSGINFYGSGWSSNIPFNRGHFDSHLSLLDDNTCLFAAKRSLETAVSMIQNGLLEHYGCDTEIIEIISNNDFSIIKFQSKSKP
jgi:hypothetical protein